MAKKTKSRKGKRGPDGLYHVQKFICTREDGTRLYKRFAAASWNDVIAEANTYKKEYLAGMHREEEQPEQAAAPLTLIDAIEKYIDTCRVLNQQDPDEYSVATIAGYASICRSIEKSPAFADVVKMPIQSLTVGALQSALNAAALPDKDGKKLSAKTIRNWWGLIKPAVDTYGPDIRLDKIKIARKKSKRTLVLSNSSIPSLLRIARQIDDDFFLYILFIAILGTRPSESYALTWGDISPAPLTSIADGVVQQYGEININKACVRDEFDKYCVKTTKSEAGTRMLSRHWSFFETLYSIKARGKDDERIISLKPSLLPYRWGKLKKEFDLPDGMVMYDLRHYHASAMEACGATARYIASDMGHSDIAITQKHYMEEISEKRQEINTKMFAHTENIILEFAGNATKSATKTPKKSNAV